MLVFGLLLTLVVLGFLSWVLFQLAVFALPFFAAVTAGIIMMHAGGGVLGAFGVGLLAGLLTLIAGQLAFTLVPSTLVRVGVAVMFMAPAVVAGYHAAHGLMAIGTPSEAWRMAVGVLGALVVGASALSRLVFRPPVSGNWLSASA